jgi:hypothetical protein
MTPLSNIPVLPDQRAWSLAMVVAKAPAVDASRIILLVEITDGRAPLKGARSRRTPNRQWGVRFVDGGRLHGCQFETEVEARTLFASCTALACSPERQAMMAGAA